MLYVVGGGDGMMPDMVLPLAVSHPGRFGKLKVYPAVPPFAVQLAE
jgi:hypothetical protein